MRIQEEIGGTAVWYEAKGLGYILLPDVEHALHVGFAQI